MRTQITNQKQEEKTNTLEPKVEQIIIEKEINLTLLNDKLNYIIELLSKQN